MIKLDVAHPDLAYTLAGNLCENDRRWIDQTYQGETPAAEAVRDTLEGSEQAFSITDEDDTLLGAFGHGPWDRSTGLGYVWLLSTARLFSHHFGDVARVFRREIIPQMDDAYTMYGATVLAENKTLLKWLKHNGFTELTQSDRTGSTFITLIRS
jgi:hypothetical protein